MVYFRVLIQFSLLLRVQLLLGALLSRSTSLCCTSSVALSVLLEVEHAHVSCNKRVKRKHGTVWHPHVLVRSGLFLTNILSGNNAVYVSGI